MFVELVKKMEYIIEDYFLTKKGFTELLVMFDMNSCLCHFELEDHVPHLNT